MTGPELRTIRQALGLSVAEFGRALGYRGARNTLSVHVRAMEEGRRPVTQRAALEALELKRAALAKKRSAR
jgi:transcriptional regulator with XRE-family HTH domain